MTKKKNEAPPAPKPAPPTAFQAGALWALGIMKRQHQARTAAWRRHEADDLGGIINAITNLSGQAMVDFEKEFVGQVFDAEKEFLAKERGE